MDSRNKHKFAKRTHNWILANTTISDAIDFVCFTIMLMTFDFRNLFCVDFFSIELNVLSSERNKSDAEWTIYDSALCRIISSYFERVSIAHVCIVRNENKRDDSNANRQRKSSRTHFLTHLRPFKWTMV